VIPWLRPGDPPTAFPPVETALTEPDGLLCAGGDLAPERLIEAYRRGIFPWFSAGQPILWWSPDPRTVLYPSELHVSRSLARTLRRRRFTTSIDQAFDAVIDGCADPQRRPEGTWITPQMRAAYLRLHQLGFAHSVEIWDGDRLAGGIYGVALGRAFFGESMFSAERDASKVAIWALSHSLQERNFRFIDCQVASLHLASLGARSLPRRDFLHELAAATSEPLAPDPTWASASFALPQPFMQNSRGPRGC
jgi:leucyl/phenylalanyl-tRNA---protein transferase